MPKVSICIPIYEMDRGEMFLKRALDSIIVQSFKDFEVIISDDSVTDKLKDFVEDYLQDKVKFKYVKNTTPKGMANNTNFAIDNATGDFIKILYQDDYFFAENSLQQIVDELKEDTKWLVTACIHDMEGELKYQHLPTYSEEVNSIGSPSVLTISKSVFERFDPKLTWVLDLELYRRLFKHYGPPIFLNEINVVIGIGDHQVTNKLTTAQKLQEELTI